MPTMLLFITNYCLNFLTSGDWSLLPSWIYSDNISQVQTIIQNLIFPELEDDNVQIYQSLTSSLQKWTAISYNASASSMRPCQAGCHHAIPTTNHVSPFAAFVSFQ